MAFLESGQFKICTFEDIPEDKVIEEEEEEDHKRKYKGKKRGRKRKVEKGSKLRSINNYSPDKASKIRAQNLEHQKKKLANEAPNQKATRYAKSAQTRKKKIETETEDERMARRARDAQRQRIRRSMESPEARKKRLATQNEYRKITYHLDRQLVKEFEDPSTLHLNFDDLNELAIDHNSIDNNNPEMAQMAAISTNETPSTATFEDSNPINNTSNIEESEETIDLNAISNNETNPVNEALPTENIIAENIIEMQRGPEETLSKILAINKHKQRIARENPEQRAKRLAISAEYKRLKIANESTEAKALRNAKDAERQRRKRAMETPQERARRLAAQNEYRKIKYYLETIDKPVKRMCFSFERAKKMFSQNPNETTEERDKRLANLAAFRRERKLQNLEVEKLREKLQNGEIDPNEELEIKRKIVELSGLTYNEYLRKKALSEERKSVIKIKDRNAEIQKILQDIFQSKDESNNQNRSIEPEKDFNGKNCTIVSGFLI